jgi:hypothetical protein
MMLNERDDGPPNEAAYHLRVSDHQLRPGSAAVETIAIDTIWSHLRRGDESFPPARAEGALERSCGA